MTAPSLDAARLDLAARIRAQLERDGPISVAAYMTLALYDRRGGYYATKEPIGAGADFITAPEISQIFGEIIGLAAVQSWLDMGAPDPFILVELGPGRGVMLADALRAARVRPAFLSAARLFLIEASPALQAQQARRLAHAPSALTWANDLSDAPDMPTIILGNEFLDCLPIRQFVRHDGAWRERMVALDPEAPDRLMFALGAPAGPHDLAGVPLADRDLPNGALIETRPGVGQLIETLARRSGPTRALFIDYGPAEGEPGDTLQAVRAHQKVDPLADTGEADLTARVDFEALAVCARRAGLTVEGPRPQGEWLLELGAEARALALIGGDGERRRAVARDLHRLTDPDEMGALFKVIAISSPGLPPAPGLVGA